MTSILEKLGFLHEHWPKVRVKPGDIYVCKRRISRLIEDWEVHAMPGDIIEVKIVDDLGVMFNNKGKDVHFTHGALSRIVGGGFLSKLEKSNIEKSMSVGPMPIAIPTKVKL